MANVRPLPANKLVQGDFIIASGEDNNKYLSIVDNIHNEMVVLRKMNNNGGSWVKSRTELGVVDFVFTIDLNTPR